MQTFQGYDALLQASPRFYDIAPEEIHAMLDCLSAKTLSYPKGSFLFHYGDHLDSLGLVLEGCVDVMKEDFWGNTNLMTRCRPGDIFGESYAIRTNCALEVSLYAEQNSTVLYLNVSKMMTLCSRACEFHNQLTRNLLSVLAERNFQLGQKLEHMTKRTTREKLLSYLSSEARRSGSSSFDIPLTDNSSPTISVDRSAMSNELCHLRDEGLISFRRTTSRCNSFVLRKSTQIPYFEPYRCRLSNVRSALKFPSASHTTSFTSM